MRATVFLALSPLCNADKKVIFFPSATLSFANFPKVSCCNTAEDAGSQLSKGRGSFTCTLWWFSLPVPVITNNKSELVITVRYWCFNQFPPSFKKRKKVAQS